tara:strand:- start:1911 stop:2264 length:354 start_codon:yes stop_codon:yes gene_type:complete
MNLKDKICVLLIVLFALSAKSQYYKEKISVVLFQAEFVEQVSLKDYRDHNTYVFDFENTKHEDYFIDETIEFLPTIVLYNNGKEVYRVEAGITLKMPENYKTKLEKEINKLIENKFR